LSCAKVGGVLYAIMGLIVGGIMSLVFMAAGSAINNESGLGAMMGGAIGIGAVVIMPIFYGVLGFVVTAISAFLYNIVANMVGGIEIEVDAVASPSRGPATPVVV
jgi:hypothetical protein